MHVQLCARDGFPLRRKTFAIVVEFLELLEDRFRDGEALFEPALFLAGGSDAEESTLAIEHLNAIPTFDESNLVIDGSDAIAQVGLRDGNVDVLAGTAIAIAGRGRKASENNE